MRYNYSTRIRSINLASSLGYLIEPNFYFCILSADIFSLDDLFYDLTGKKSLEWLKVNKECKKIENTDFTLKKMVLNKYTPENYKHVIESGLVRIRRPENGRAKAVCRQPIADYITF